MRKTRIATLIATVAVIACIPIALASGAASSPPTATTAAASAVGNSGATLNASVNPNGQQTSYEFQWGPTTGYGHETTFGSAGTGTSAVTETAALTDLAPGTTYHFRILAVNASGTTVGSDMAFTTTGTAPVSTPAPSASTGSVANLATDGATLGGTVTPAGNATDYYFEYGPTANYGFQTPTQSAGSGNSAVNVTAGVSGLQPGTTYHYRLVVVSGAHTVLGNDATFTTSSATTTPPAPTQSRVSFIGREGFVSPGRVIGVEAACLGGSTSCSGHVTIQYGSEILGQRDFTIAPDTGGFENIKLSSHGASLLRSYNSVFHLLPVTVNVTTSTGQHLTTTIHLARWVWN
jgi:hypothetical protein